MLFSKDAAAAITAALALSLSVVAVCSHATVTGAQWLTNGSFDGGLTGWTVVGSTAEGCGSGAAGLLANDDGPRISQNVNGTFTPGTYHFRGVARTAGSGAATGIATVSSLESSATGSDDFAIGTSPTAFDVTFETNATLGAVRVSFTAISDQDTTVCLDDLSLEGPDGAEPAPTDAVPTATSVPPTLTPTVAVPTATGTAVVDATASVTSVPTATSTVAPGATSTSAVPTATTAATPGFVFINGGFEDGVAGWQTNGGDIDAVSSPRSSGTAAGRFSSNSATTKWLYQVVAIDAAKNYEFQGALMAEGAVAEAYLRVSWYASSDGSGQLITSDDSTARITGGSNAFSVLTTGPIVPPSGARTARARVMLALESSAQAAVYLDDFSFGTTSAAPSTPTATPPVATQTAVARAATQEPTGEAASDDEPVVMMTNELGTPRVATTAEVAAIRATAASSQGRPSEELVSGSPRGGGGASNLPPPADLQPQVNEEPAPLWPYFAVPAAGIFGLLGYIYSRKRGRVGP